MKALPPAAETVLDAAADAAGIERSLVRAVSWVESRGNPRAVSRAGAMGLMQLMPRTAHGLGVLSESQLRQVQEAMAAGGPAAVKKLDLPTFDPATNANAGARYLARLLAQSADTAEALARYNWGTGNVTKRGGWPRSVQVKYVSPVLQRLKLERQHEEALRRDDATPRHRRLADAPAEKEGDRKADRPFAAAEASGCSLPCPSCGTPLMLIERGC